MTTPPDAMIDVYYAIQYADFAALAAVIAGGAALEQRDTATMKLAQQATEDAYCAAGFAYCAKISEGVFHIGYCLQDAERAKDAAISHASQALKAALDADPAKLAPYEEAYKALLDQQSSQDTLHAQMNDFAEMCNYVGVSEDEAREMFMEEHGTPPPAMPDAQMIEKAWWTFRERYSDAYHVPNTLAAQAERYRLDDAGKPRTAEAVADFIAYHQAAERGPKGECRYCGESFKKVKESVNKGRCLRCDHTYVTDLLAGLYEVFAYDPETGEMVYGSPSDDTDDASDGTRED